MAFTTYAAFISSLAALTIVGVTRKAAAPPKVVTTGGLPLSYPRIPEMEREVISFGSATGLNSVRAELVILIGATTMGEQTTNFNDATALVDAIDTTLTAAVDTLNIDRWSIRPEAIVVGDVPFWGLVVLVEASG